MFDAFSTDTQPMVEDLACKYGCCDRHASFVRTAAEVLFDALLPLHMLGPEEKSLLSHAAQLHDIGNFVNKKKHHCHAKYIIEHDTLLQHYPEKQRHLLALLVYNHRKKLHDKTYLLSDKEKNIVLKLSAILRVADALDTSREEISLASVHLLKNRLVIQLEHVLLGKLAPRMQKKKILFVEEFGLDIELIL